MKVWTLPVLVGLAISIISGLIVIPWGLKGQHELDDLKDRGVRIQATIIRVEPENHAQCTYGFNVDGQYYESTGGSCADIPLGQSIPVYYLPDDPNISTNGELGMSDPGFWIGVIWMVFVMPAFMTYLWIRRRLALRSR